MTLRHIHSDRGVNFDAPPPLAAKIRVYQNGRPPPYRGVMANTVPIHDIHISFDSRFEEARASQFA